jgi:hypothetical protein
MTRQAEQAAPAKPDKADKGTGKLIVTGVLMLPVIAVLMPSCIVLAINMAPTMVAYVIDRTREKYLVVTVGLLNICGTLPAEAELWSRGQTYNTAMDIASDPFFWLMAYGAAAIGWAIYLALPPILERYYGITSQARLQVHRRKKQVLIEAWGEEVAGEITEARSQ